MNKFIFISGVVLGAGVVWVVLKGRMRELEIELKRTEREKEEQTKIVSGFEDFNRQQEEIKEARKQKILGELAKRSKIKTNQVADFLEVSRATAFRYLEELEKEGKIEQIGAYGRNVEYKLKAVNAST
jgi:predicted HTH transcriptional regulator